MSNFEINPSQSNPTGPGSPTPQSEKREGRKVKSTFLFILTWILLASGFGVLMIFIGYWHFSRTLPQLISVSDYHPLGVTRVISKGPHQEGSPEVVGEFFKEKRYVVSYEKIPELIIQAVISAEDNTFFEHQGISLTAILRATVANFKAGHVVQGGSTITQQVAKSLFLSSERSFIRKFKEAILAGRIEENLTKEQILFLYLNQIYLGHGAYGIQAAARVFFHKDISQLSLPEAALVAAMPRAPSKFSPFLNPQRAKERQRYVLRRMVDNGFISEGQMLEAAAEPIRIFRATDQNETTAPYYLEHIRRYLVQEFGEEAVYEEGLTVIVPDNLKSMKLAEASLKEGLREIDKRRGYRGPLRRLETDDEINKFLVENREKLIRNTIPYEVFLPDGRMGLVEAMEDMGMFSDFDLLKEGELYEAVVTRVLNSEKKAEVMISSVALTLPMEEMKWARQVTDENTVSREPEFPSQVVKEGDVVLVQVKPYIPPKEDPKKEKEKKESEEEVPYIASLEQLPEIQGALYSLDVRTGNVLAMIGGYSYESSEFNRVNQAQRQPGSAFKPLIYSLGIESGFTPVSIIVDSPIVFKDEEVGTWKPSNFAHKFYGDTLYHRAFIKSRNIPTIKLVQTLKIPSVIDYAKRLGLSGKFNEDLSISLGSASTSLADLTHVYALFPRLGYRINPIYFNKILNRDGLVLEENEVQALPAPKLYAAPTPEEKERYELYLASLADWDQKKQVLVQEGKTEEEIALLLGERPKTDIQPIRKMPENFEKAGVYIPELPTEENPDLLLDPRVAYIMTHLMKEVISHGTGRRAKVLERPAAGKTGTTNDNKDAWFMGFTPHLVTGVWIGYDDQTLSLGRGETGSKAALPIWIQYMKAMMESYPEEEFLVPPGVTFATIDPDTGKLLDTENPNGRLEAFLTGTEPTQKLQKYGKEVDTESDFLKEAFE